jgi:phage antirepressor YoqD-like protein
MGKLINAATPTMSSREIADLVESRPADVCRTIERLMLRGAISRYAPMAYTHPQNGQQYAEYRVNERDSLAEQRDALQREVVAAAPKVEALDRLTLADGSMCITNAAKALQVQPKALFKRMSADQWIYRRPGSAEWTAYQDKLQRGLLEHKITTVNRTDGSEKVTSRVLVMAKGLTALAQKMGH